MGDEGAVLIWVFWLLLALSIIVLGALHLSTLHYGILSVSTSRAEMRYAAEGAIYQAIYDKLRENATSKQREARTFQYAIGRFSIAVNSRNEAGKISLNHAEEALISAAFATYGLSETEALRLAAAVIDWRDEDALPRPGGAEAPQYAQKEMAPRNAAFETLGELRRVRGVTDQLFSCISPIFSVYPTTGQVDLEMAEDNVMRVLSWAQDRHWQGREWQSDSQGSSVLNPFSSAGGDVFQLIASVQGLGQENLTLEAYIRITGNTSHPYDILVMHETFRASATQEESCAAR